MRPSTRGADTAGVALALGAGGTKGWAHVGVLTVLSRAGVRIDSVTGASAGALIGAMYAARPDGEALCDLALGFTPREFTDWFLRGLRIAPDGVAMSQRLWQAFGRFDFSELPVSFAAVGHDLATRDRLVLQEGSVATAVEGSIRPLVFGAAKSWNDSYIVDGGFQRAVPADIARRMGADVVIAVSVGAFIRVPRSLRPLTVRLARSLKRRSASSAPHTCANQLAFLAELLAREKSPLADADVLIRPDMRGISAFSPWHIAAAVRRGEIAARRALPAIQRMVAEGPVKAPSACQHVN